MLIVAHLQLFQGFGSREPGEEKGKWRMNWKSAPPLPTATWRKWCLPAAGPRISCLIKIIYAQIPDLSTEHSSHFSSVCLWGSHCPCAVSKLVDRTFHPEPAFLRVCLNNIIKGNNIIKRGWKSMNRECEKRKLKMLLSTGKSAQPIIKE